MLLFEEPLQMALIREAGLVRHTGDAFRRLAQEPRGAVEPQVAQVVGEAPASRFLEERSEAARAHSGDRGDGWLRDLGMTMLADVLEDPTEPRFPLCPQRKRIEGTPIPCQERATQVKEEFH